MLDDYQSLIEQSVVYVACQQEEIVGVLVLLETDEGFRIETIAVLPSAQGIGIGGKLLAFAEAVALNLGYISIYLSTHRMMYESQAIYAHFGYVEFDQRVINGYDRLFIRKKLL